MFFGIVCLLTLILILLVSYQPTGIRLYLYAKRIEAFAYEQYSFIKNYIKK